jgi:hypothetical protein
VLSVAGEPVTDCVAASREVGTPGWYDEEKKQPEQAGNADMVHYPVTRMLGGLRMTAYNAHERWAGQHSVQAVTHNAGSKRS